MNQWFNQLMNDGGDCRTAPATPGLLKKILVFLIQNGTSNNNSEGTLSSLIFLGFNFGFDVKTLRFQLPCIKCPYPSLKKKTVFLFSKVVNTYE